MNSVRECSVPAHPFALLKRLRWLSWLVAGFLALGCISSAQAIDRLVATTGEDSGNCTGTPCRTLGYAISQASSSGDTIRLGHSQSGNLVFAEHVTVNKSVTIRGTGSTLGPGNNTAIVAPAGGGVSPALLTITAPDVVIEDIVFGVDFAETAQAIRADSVNTNGLTIRNVRIRAEYTGLPDGEVYAYSQRNAIWINPANAAGYGNNYLIEDVIIDDDGNPDASIPFSGRFRAGVDARRIGLTLRNSDIVSVSHDVLYTGQNVGQALVIQNNWFRGYGIQYTSPNSGTGSVLIDNNHFVARSDLDGNDESPIAGDHSAMRLIGNGQLIAVTISNNFFEGYERGVLIENFPGVNLNGNDFKPRSGSSAFQYVRLSNKQLVGNTPPPVPMCQALTITATGNTFHGGTVGGGTAVYLLNDNANPLPVGCPGYYGPIVLSGNDFKSELGRYVEMADFTCVSTHDDACPLKASYFKAVGNISTGTPVVPFAGNVDATAGNKVDGVDVSGFTLTQQSEVLAHTYDQRYHVALGSVSWGFDLSTSTFADAQCDGQPVGTPITFTHAEYGTASLHCGLTVFASVQDALAHVDDHGTVYVAKGSYAAATIAKPVTLIGDGVALGEATTLAGLSITVSGAEDEPLLFKNFVVTNSAGVGLNFTSAVSHLRFEGVAFDGNGSDGVRFSVSGPGNSDIAFVGPNCRFAGNTSFGVRTALTASASNVLFEGCAFTDNLAGLVLFGGAGGASSGVIANWRVSQSQFIGNNDGTGDYGGGIWIKTGGAGSAIDGFIVEDSLFRDNGSSNALNRNGISVRARPGATLSGVGICGNIFEDTALPAVQDAGIYVFDDTGVDNTAYMPVEICADNQFIGLARSVSGIEQFTSRHTQPIVLIEEGAAFVPPPENINIGFVLNEDTGKTFRSINAAIADTDTESGHTIYAPAGVYNENVLLSKAVTLRGESAASTLTIIDGTGKAAGSGVTFGSILNSAGSGVPGSTLKYLSITNFNVGEFACVYGPIGSSNTTIDKVIVDGCAGSGAGVGGSGIAFAAGAAVDGITVSNSEIAHANNRGIVIWDGLKTNITFTGNVVHDLTGCCGIELQDGRASGVTVTGNHVWNVGDAGMSFKQLDGSSGPNLIAYNTVGEMGEFNGRFGIEIKMPNGTGNDGSDPGDTVVSNNVVTRGTVAVGSVGTRDWAGIAVFRRSFVSSKEVDVVRGVVVKDNTVTGFAHPRFGDELNEGYGILIEGDQMLVTGNTLSGNDIGIQRQAGNPDGAYPAIDSNQDSTHPDFFSRGNAPLVCAEVAGNSFSGNAVNERVSTLPAELNVTPVVTNVDTGLRYCTIQAAISAPETVDGHELRLADDTVFAEQVDITKRVKITRGGTGTNKPVIATPETVALPNALFRVKAQDVTIDGLEFKVDFDRLGIAIAAIPGGDLPNGLKILNNTIIAMESSGDGAADETGSGAAPWGVRRAISINDRNAANVKYGASQFPATAAIKDILIEGNVITTSGAVDGALRFTSAIELDDPNTNPNDATSTLLIVRGNQINARYYSANVRWNNGIVTFEDNVFTGGTLEVAEAEGPFNVLNNVFAPVLTNGSIGSLSIKNTSHGNANVLIECNTFNAVSPISVISNNSHGWHLVNNTFNAPAAGEFVHLWIDTRSVGNSPTAGGHYYADARGNTFNGPDSGPRGRAVVLANHHNDAARVAGSVVFGASGEENSFTHTGNFSYVFELVPTTCPGSSSSVGCTVGTPAAIFAQYNATPVAPWPVDVAAGHNTFDGVSPSAMTVEQILALQQLTYHDDPNAPETPAAPAALGRVLYGFQEDQLATTTTIVSISPATSVIGQPVTVTVAVGNEFGGVPSGSVAISALDSAGCVIVDYPAATDCTIAAGFAVGGPHVVTAAFTPAENTENQASTSAAYMYLVQYSGSESVTVQSTAASGDAPTALDNDYTRINNVVQSAAAGLTITLEGDFDWLEPFALESWRRGSDGVLGTDDDWSIKLPAGINGVTLRAAAKGTASVQGSEGDPGNGYADFTAFIYSGAKNQDWTFENLTVRGFDIAFAMFGVEANNGSIDGLDGTAYLNNRIEIGPDSGDDYANFGIYSGFGRGQTIVGNEIVIDIEDADGDESGAHSRSVGIQIGDSSNNNVFDELFVSGNTIEVVGTTLEAIPPRVIGLWENAGDHGSDIEIEDNVFAGSGDLGDGVENNNQTGLIVTSQSNPGKRVVVRGNTVADASIGFISQLPFYGHYVAGNEPLLIEGNTFTGNGTGLRLLGAYPNPGKYVIRYNRIVGNGIGLFAERADDLPLPGAPHYGGDELPSQIDANDNWWGCNEGPNGSGCDAIEIEGGDGSADVTQETWLVLTVAADPELLELPDVDASTVAIAVTTNSAGDDLTDGGTVVIPFPRTALNDVVATRGDLAPVSGYELEGGLTLAVLGNHVLGKSTITAALDNATASDDVLVRSADGKVYVTVNDDPGNDASGYQHASVQATCDTPDYDTIHEAIDVVPDGSVIIVCPGEYAESLEVDHPVTLLGAQVGVDARDRSLGADEESLILPATGAAVNLGGADLDYSALANAVGNVVQITAPDVVFDGFTVDADNPGIASVYPPQSRPATATGANPDVAVGILVGAASATVSNNIVRNASYAGIRAMQSDLAGAPITGSVFSYNRIQDSDGNFYGSGIELANNFYAEVAYNRTTGVRNGIQFSNINKPAAVVNAINIHDNEIGAKRVGLRANLANVDASRIRIADNNVTGESGYTALWQGVWVQSLFSTAGLEISGNTISGGTASSTASGTVGYLLGNTIAGNAIVGGEVSNVQIGVLAGDANFYAGPVLDYEVTGVKFTNIAGVAPIYVEDTIDAAGGARITVGSGNDFSGAGTEYDLALSGAGATASGTVARVLVRAERDFVYGAPLYESGKACSGNTSAPLCLVTDGTINNGIAAANVGGVVTVEAGTFEQDVLVDKSVTLRGAKWNVAGDGLAGIGQNLSARDGSDETIIHAPEKTTAESPRWSPVRIGADGVTIEGFTITGEYERTDIAGIASGSNFTASGNNAIVRNNRFVELEASGVYTNSASNLSGWQVYDNLFQDIGGGLFSAINLWKMNDSVIRHNTIIGTGFGGVSINGNVNADVYGNEIEGTPANAINLGPNLVNASVHDNVVSAIAASEGAVVVYGGSNGVTFACNVINVGAGVTTFAAQVDGSFGPLGDVRLFHNEVTGAASASNDNSATFTIGSNYYGDGGIATDANVQAADALPASPIGHAACGDNTAYAIAAISPLERISTEINAGFNETLIARVTDQFGGAVRGEAVAVSVPSVNASASLSAVTGGLSGSTGSTNYNGVLELAAQANGFAGMYQIGFVIEDNFVADAGNAIVATFDLENLSASTNQIVFDINGPIAGVQVGGTATYSGRVANLSSSLELSESVYVHVDLGGVDEDAAPMVLDPADVSLCVVDPLDAGECLPLAWQVAGNGLMLDLAGFALPPGYDALRLLRVVFAKAGVYSFNASLLGVDTGTVYSSDALSTEVIAEHAGVHFDITGPVAGVERDTPADYIAILSNSAAALTDNVAVEVIITRDAAGGIALGDLDLYYDADPGAGEDYVAVPLFFENGEDGEPGLIRANFGSPDGFLLAAGGEPGSEIVVNLRAVFHVAPDTYRVAATVIDADATDMDGVSIYAGDEHSTAVIEPDPNVDVSLAGPFDAADGQTPVQARVGAVSIVRADLANAGVSLPDPVQARFVISRSGAAPAGLSLGDPGDSNDGDIYGRMWYIASGSQCVESAAVPAGAIVALEDDDFTQDGETLVFVSSAVELDAGYELTACFELGYRRAGLYSIGVEIVGASATVYAGDYLNFTVNKGVATLELVDDDGVIDGVIHRTYTGAPQTVSATTTTPIHGSIDVTYSGLAVAPSAVGTYIVVAILDDPDWEGSIAGELEIEADTAATITLDAPLTRIYDGQPQGVTATTNPSGLAYSLSYEGESYAGVPYGPSAVPPVSAGEYEVTATITDPSYYGSTPATGELVIEKAGGTAVFSAPLSAPYGSTHAATATIQESGEACDAVVGLPSPVSNAATYPLSVECNGANHVASGSANYVVTKAMGTVQFAPLSGPYGSVHAVTASIVQEPATSAPANGVPAQNAPAGSYIVTADLDGVNYIASGTGTYTVTAANVVLDLVGSAVGVAHTDAPTFTEYTADAYTPGGAIEPVVIEFILSRVGGIAEDDLDIAFRFDPAIDPSGTWNDFDAASGALTPCGNDLCGTFDAGEADGFLLPSVSTPTTWRISAQRGGRYSVTAAVVGHASGIVYAVGEHVVDVADIQLSSTGNASGVVGAAVNSAVTLANIGTADLSNAADAPNDENVRGRFVISLLDENDQPIPLDPAEGICGSAACASEDIAVEYYDPVTGSYVNIYNLRLDDDGVSLYGHFGSVASGGQPVPAGASGTFLLRTTFKQKVGRYTIASSVVGIETGKTYTSTSSSVVIGAGAAHSIAIVSGDQGEAVVGGNTYDGGPLVVEVRDVGGNLLPGELVAFTVMSSSGAGAGFTAPATTGADGRTSIAPLSNDTAGGFEIVASVGNVAPVAFTLTNFADATTDQIVVLATGGTPQTAPANAQFGIPLSVRATDRFGNPLAGLAVAFTPDGTTANAFIGVPAPTDANGETSVVATANSQLGSYTVTANVPGSSNADAVFALTNTPTTATSFTVTGPASTVEQVLGEFGDITVTVFDALDAPVQGVSVTFTAPASGASAAFGTVSGANHFVATTDENGVATVKVFANAIASPMTYAVDVTVSGAATTSPAVQLTNLPGEAANVTLSASPTAAVSGSGSYTLTAFVIDANGNAVADGTVVTFSAPTLPNAGVVTPADWSDATVNGVAIIVLDANTVPGSFGATATSGAASGAVSLTNLEASSITVSLIGPALAQATQPDGAWQLGFTGTISNTGTMTAQPVHTLIEVVRIDDGNADPISASNSVQGGDIDACIQFGDSTVTADCDSGYFSLHNGKRFVAGGGHEGRDAVTFRYPNQGAYDLPLPNDNDSPLGGPVVAPLEFRFAPGQYRLVSRLVGSDGHVYAASAPLIVTVPDAGVVVGGANTGSALESLVSSVQVVNNGGPVPQNVKVRLSLGSANATASDFPNLVDLGGGVYTFSPSGSDFALFDGYDSLLTGRVQFAEEGVYTVTAELVDADGFLWAAHSHEVAIGAHAALFTLSDLSQVYVDASTPHPVGVASTPAGVPYTVLYETKTGADCPADPIAPSTAAPIDAGSYCVYVTAEAPYSGSASGVLVVAKAMGTVQFAPLSGPYGSVHAVTATISETGEACGAVQGVPAADAMVGSYVVAAGCEGGNHVASGSAVYVVTALDVGLALDGDAVGVAHASPVVYSYAMLQKTGVDTVAEPVEAFIAIERVGGIADGDITIEFDQPGTPEEDWTVLTPVGATADVLTYSLGSPFDLSGFLSTNLRVSAQRGGHYVATASLVGTGGVVYAMDGHTFDIADLQLSATPVAMAAVAGTPVASSMLLSNTGSAALADGIADPNGENVVAHITVSSGTSLTTGAVTLLYLDDGDYLEIPFIDNGDGTLSAIFGPPVTGFPVAAGYAATTLFQGSFLLPGGYTIATEVVGIETGTRYASATQTVAVDVGEAATIELVSGDAQSTTVGAVFGEELVVRVRDVAGNVVDGAAVAFNAIAVDGAGSDSGSGATSAGLVGFLPTANTVAGSYTVRTSIANGQSVEFVLTNLADDDPAQVKLGLMSGDAQTAQVGTDYGLPLVVKATDRFGNVLEGIDVGFSVAAGAASVSIANATATTDASGEASSGLVTANAVAGVVTVTTTADADACDPLSPDSVCTVDFGLTNTSGGAASVSLSTDNATAAVNTSGAYTLTATVLDGSGNPVEGVSVTLIGPSSGAGVSPAVFAGLTDAEGVVEKVFDANAAAGVFEVQAVVSGVGPASVTLTNTAGAAAKLELVSGSGQSAAVGTAFVNALVAKVTDIDGNPVAGETVNFTVPGSGASAMPSAASAVSDADGLVSITATANATAGGYDVVANATSFSASVNFALTNTVGGVSITDIVWADTGTAATTYDGTAKVATATVSGGHAVTFTYNGSAVAPTAAGEYLVIATVDDGNVAGSAQAILTIERAPTSAITLAGGTFVYDGTAHPATVGNAAGIPYTLTYAPGGSAPVNAGSYTATLTVTDPNHVPLSLTAGITITPSTNHGITLAGGTFVYDGAPHGATVTNPNGVAYALAYDSDDGNAPVDAGDYTATLTITDPNYDGAPLTASIMIGQAQAQILLLDLIHFYDGTPKQATVVTVPSGLPVTVTYDPANPVEVGDYEVTVELSGQRNYADQTVSGTLRILAAAVAGWEIVGSDTFTGIAGTTLDPGPTVRVYDKFGHGVPGISVVFTPGANSGSVAESVVTTDADGLAVAEWTLDADAGTDTLVASVSISGLSELNFSATSEEVADLAISKTSEQTDISFNELLTYTLVVTNIGPSNAAEANILDELPEGLNVATATWLCAGSAGAVCSGDDGMGDVDVSAAIPVGGSITVTLTARVLPDATPGPLTNEAVVVLVSGTEADDADNADSYTLPVVVREDEIFKDDFEDEGGALHAKPKGLAPAWERIGNAPVVAVEVVGEAGKAQAWIEALQVGEQRWYRLRWSDAVGVEHAGFWNRVAAELELDVGADYLQVAPADDASAGAQITFEDEARMRGLRAKAATLH